MTDNNRSRTRLRLITALMIGVVLLVGLSQAATAAEPRDPIQREDIALIEKQLARIEPIIDRLQKRQDAQPNRRVILDIVRLRSDINAIRNGLRAYLAPPRLPPRRPPPLIGQYLAQQPSADR